MYLWWIGKSSLHIMLAQLYSSIYTRTSQMRCRSKDSLSNFCQKIISLQFFEMGLTSFPPIWTMSINILFLGAKAPLDLARFIHSAKSLKIAINICSVSVFWRSFKKDFKGLQNTNYIGDRRHGRLFYGTPGSQGSLFNKRPRCLELFWKMYQLADDADDGEFSSGMEQEIRRSSYCCFNLMNWSVII